MKKHFYLAFLSAIALTGTLSFTSCSSADDLLAEEPQPQVEDNPTYNPRTGEVNVDFVMNIATANSTRMTAANTQATTAEAFRGMQNAYLLTYALASDGGHVSTATTATKDYSLGTIMGAGYLDPDGTGSTPKSRRVLELALPTGTNTLMFWGKAIKSGENADNAQGKVIWKADNKNIAQHSFELARRIPADGSAWGQTAYGQYQSLMAKALTTIVNSQVAYNVTYNGQTKSGTMKWSDYVEVSGSGTTATLITKTTDPSDGTGETAMSPLGEILCDAFKTMNTINTNEVRAGAGGAIAAMIGDLFNVISRVADATPTSIEEAIAKQVGEAVRTSINKCFKNNGTAWQTASTVKSAVSWSPASGDDLVGGDDVLNAFPSNFNVPAGAAVLKFDIYSGNDLVFTYSYKNNIPTYQMSGEAGGSFNIFNYRYPAEICYFGNSPIRATNETKAIGDYPDGTTNWDAESSWTGWTDSHVLSTTRSVAMKENINYGTAMLKTTVGYGAGTLYDNNEHFHPSESNKEISVTTAGVFTLTGVLIGGVEAEVGWNYIAKAGSSAEFNSFIYDSDLPSTAIPAYSSGTIYSTPNYTLVWDNWNPAFEGGDQNVVYVALEFVNNSGKDFWGMNNLIRRGQTFYISGKLDPDVATAATLEALGKTAEEYESDKSLGITWPTKYALPPYATSGPNIGNTIKERRVFIQDFVTEAKFIVGATSLQKAIVALPDLRSTQISLGLSVDLEWSQGLTFESVLGQ